MLRHLKGALTDFREALRSGGSEPTLSAPADRGEAARPTNLPPQDAQPVAEPSNTFTDVPSHKPAEAEPAEARFTGGTSEDATALPTLHTPVPVATEMPEEADDAGDTGGALSAQEVLAEAPAEAVTDGASSGVRPTVPTTAVRRRWVAALIVVGLAALALGLGAQVWASVLPPEPADPQVVATYSGGTVTREQLKREFEALPKDDQPFYRTLDGLKVLVADVVVHEVTRRWAEEKQVDQKQVFNEAMKHATEEIQIADVSDQLHRGRIQVGEAEIQAYYDRNRQRFGERTLIEAKDEVRRAVVEEKEGAFVKDYLKDLKERASLQVDYSLLDVPEPTEQEIAGYYQANRGRFKVAEQARIAQIQVSVSLAGGDEPARARAEAARARATAGEDFAQLAGELSDGPEKAEGGMLKDVVMRGSRGSEFDGAVFQLQAGGLSPVFKEGDSYYIVKLIERFPGRERSYAETRGEIRSTLLAERERQLYDQRKGRTLFTIHSRRTTLGEFLQEIEELAPDQREVYAGPAGKRRLLDRLVERLLVVEDTSEQATEVKRKEEIEQARTELLGRMLHEEQVDERVEVSDEEVRAEYDRNRERYSDPPKVKVRYVRVSRGLTADEDQRARAKIEEAEAKLRPGGLFGSGDPPADFSEVAKQYSEDPETAIKGGELDRWLGESEDQVGEMLEHALHQELLPRKVGEITPILPVGDSYYLFQIREKQEARPRSFEEVRELARQQLEARKHEELSQAMQRDFLARTQLQIYDGRITGVLTELGGPAAGGP